MEQIYDLYFNQGLRQVDISEKLGKSKAYVTKVLKKYGELYTLEKEKRKVRNKERRKLNNSRNKNNENAYDGIPIEGKLSAREKAMLLEQKLDFNESINQRMSDNNFVYSNLSAYSWDTDGFVRWNNKYGEITVATAPRRINIKR